MYPPGPLQNFKISKNPKAPKGSVTSMYVSEENSKRCLFKLPRVLFPNYVEFCNSRRRKGREDWNAGYISVDEIALYLLSWLTFDYEEDGHRRNNLNFFQFYQARHPEIFIVADERDYQGKKRTKDMHHWVIGWLRKRIDALPLQKGADRRKSMNLGTPRKPKPPPRRPRSSSFGSKK
jgi:hypothetical protein